jgi:thiol-disulfide isomerase/thioredoxin
MKKILRFSRFAAVFVSASLSFSAYATGSAAALKEHFPNGLINAKGEKIPLESLEGKAIGIYFSAQWCGPCRAFTPSLVEYRNANKEKFEVVFVSSDRTPDDQIKYMTGSKMDFPAVALQDAATKALKERYEVRGIPTLVILKSNGEFLSRDGRKMINDKVDAAKLADPTARIETYKCDQCPNEHTRLASGPA